MIPYLDLGKRTRDGFLRKQFLKYRLLDNEEIEIQMEKGTFETAKKARVKLAGFVES